MPTGDFSVIVIGASAGGVPALKQLFESLPPDLPAAIFVVLHFPSSGTSYLPEILSKLGPLKAHHVIATEEIRAGEVYVAPPNRHLEVDEVSVAATTAPKENRNRPAINPLFRSAARAFGPRVIGVVLSGILDDGTAGLWEIKRHGGKAVVQSPADADHPQMPQSAIANVDVDYVVPIDKMADILASLCKCETAHEY
ncbi:MAG TPA: chemotaxis protein CheB [Candidatus Acidoferrales bacterium]|nr:chemotaxis protein CheB [Candidatus Acidoferrales bacterium]